MIQTSLFVERINQFPILSYVIDISPHTIMAVSLQEKEGENKKETPAGGGERERERLFLAGQREVKSGGRQTEF